MTDNTEAGLLDDIIANPADDVPRLIYADWLEDHDRYNTARFIRQQIAGDVGMVPLLDVARIVDPMGIDGLGRRKASKEDCTWTSRCDTVQVVFRRGFLAEIHAPLDMLLEHLPRLVLEHPIEAVRAVDAVPRYSPASDPLRYGWTDSWSSDQPQRGHLPDAVYAALLESLGVKGVGPPAVWFADLDAAHAALSAALLTWAKSLPRDTT